MMLTNTFVENVNDQKPLFGHHSLLLCLQLKLDATENLNQDAFEHVIPSKARIQVLYDHDGNNNIFEGRQTQQTRLSAMNVQFMT